MPIATVIMGGLATGNSQLTLLPLPVIPGRAYGIHAVNVVRGGGALLTDGDTWMIGLAHQIDLPLTNDQDMFIGIQENNTAIWWSTDLIPHAAEFDTFNQQILVAGPQAIIVHNGSGGTTAGKISVHYDVHKLGRTAWTLLKTLTSFEGVP